MALAGVRVLDLSRLLPGSFCTQLLGDLGADVIKLEQPGEGDGGRHSDPKQGDVGAIFLLISRNKRSLTLNLKAPEGKELFLRLVRTADVVFETFRPGVMERLGLGYERLAEENPRLVYASLSGFGQEGPYRDRAGHDLNYLALAGIIGLNGAAASGPVPPAVQVADLGGASLVAMGILAALLARERTGRGQRVDASLFGAAMAWLPTLASSLFATGRSPQLGEPVLAGGLPHYAVYATLDGRYVTLAALEPKFLQAFLEKVERPELLPLAYGSTDERQQLRTELAALFALRTQAEWEALLSDVDTCFAPVRTVQEAVDDPHVQACGMISAVTHPRLGIIPQLGVPLALSDTPAAIRRPPPDLGEHTAEVLAEVGVDAARLADLKARAVT
jgi:crotonobetainyl-CoA:carnitine CoA-transferase CaiB-like acyl-CoA transferase